MASHFLIEKPPKDLSVEQPQPGYHYGLYSRPDLTVEDNALWGQIRKIIHKRYRLILKFALGLEVIFLLFVLFLPNKYTAHATLEISPEAVDPVQLRDSSAPAATPTQQDYLDTQSELLRSDYLAMRVIQDLHLDQNSEFYSPGLLSRSLNRISRLIHRSSAQAAPSNSVESLLQTFHAGLGINQVKNSNLVDASFESDDPKLATAIVNSLVRIYLDDAHRNRYESTLKAAEAMAPELNDLKNSVAKSNQSLIDYQKTHEGTELAGAAPVAAGGSNNAAPETSASNPIAVRASQLNQQLTQSIADRLQQESYVNQIALGHNDTLPQMKDSPLIQDLTKQLVESRAQLAQALAVYGSNNPQVRKILQQTNALDTQLNTERDRIADQIKSSYNAAKVREALLRKSLHDLKGSLDTSNANALQFDLMQREAQAQSNLYIETSSRIKELAVAASLSSNNVRVLDDARLPEHASGPHRMRILGAGIFLGLIGGVVLAFVAEGMDDTISSEDDIRRLSGMPALALLPSSSRANLKRLRHVKTDQALFGGVSASTFTFPVLQFLKEKPDSPEAEAIRSLETSIRITAQAKEKPIKTVLITSAFPGEGKTTVATNLATALSRHHKTCLIDADLRHPVITPTYGLSRRVGLQDLLVKPDLVDQLDSAPDNPNLTVLGAGLAIRNSIDKVSSVAMQELVEKLKSRFDYVVIDSPPLIPFAESKWLSSLADGIVVVARCSTTTRRALTLTLDMLGDVQERVLGVVLNGVDLDAEYYAYGTDYRSHRQPKTA